MEAKAEESQSLLQGLQVVFFASQRLKKLRKSSMSLTEADYAAQVWVWVIFPMITISFFMDRYNVLRIMVGQLSDNRYSYIAWSLSIAHPDSHR